MARNIRGIHGAVMSRGLDKSVSMSFQPPYGGGRTFHYRSRNDVTQFMIGVRVVVAEEIKGRRNRSGVEAAVEWRHRILEETLF